MISAASWRELWRFRELFYFLVWRDLKVRYKQTKLGASWAILQPLVMMIVFTFIGQVAALGTEDLPGTVFYYSALVPWTYFANAVTNAGNSLVANAPLLTKVYFPRVTLPTAPVLAGLVDFAIAAVVFVGLLVWHGIIPNWTVVLWPFLLVLLALQALGFGLIFAALNVRYRDVKYALPFLVQVWLLASPILVSAERLPRALNIMNPMSGILDAFRASIRPEVPLDWTLLAVSALATVVVLGIGVRVFTRTERAFADIV